MPQIKLNANLRNIAGVKEATVQGKTLIEGISDLIRKFPNLEEVIFEDGQIREHFILTINGHHSTELNQSVNDDDIIAIFPPISGG